VFPLALHFPCTIMDVRCTLVLLASWYRLIVSPVIESMRKKEIIPLWLLILAVSSVVIGVTMGFYFTQVQRNIARQQREEELTVIATLTEEQLSGWMEERIGDANVVKDNPLIWHGWHADELMLEDESLLFLKSVQENYDFCDILLSHPEETIAISISGRQIELHHEITELIDLAVETDQVQVTGIHGGACDDSPHIDLLVPYGPNQNRDERVIILQTRTDEFLYPLIQQFPLASESGEILLVRLEGESALFLNDLRHVEEAALNLRIPLSADEVPAVQAVMGTEGVVIGKDYRGVEVMAVINAVERTDWYLIAKMDLAEIDAVWQRQVAVTIITAVLFVTAIVGFAALFWQRDLKKAYRSQSEMALALAESEEKFRSYVDNAPYGIFVTDDKGRYVDANPAACKITGYEREELLAMGIKELVAPVSQEASSQSFQRLLQTGYTNSESKFINKSGEERDWVVKAVKLADDRLLGFVDDATEQKQAQRAYQEMQAKYDLAMSATEQGIWEWNLTTDVVFWNLQMEQLLGEAGQEHTFTSWGKRLHPDDQAAVNRALQAHIAGLSDIWQAQYRIRNENDGWIWVLGKGRVVERDENGQPLRMAGTMTDISTLHELQELLRYRESQLQRVFDLMPVGVWLADANGKLYYANQAAQEIWGGKPLVAAEEYGIFKAKRLPSGDEVQADEWSILRSIREGVNVENELLEVEGLDGKTRVILCYTAPLYDLRGKLEGGIEVNYDITKLHQAQEEVRRFNRTLERRVRQRTTQLQAASEEMEAFVYSVSHDLRAPLRAIDGYSHLLEEAYLPRLDTEGLRLLHNISRNIINMNHLIDGLLNFSRINRIDLDHSPVKMKKLAEDVAAELGVVWQTDQKMILIQPLPDSMGDGVMLRQVWQNLIDNAIKFSRTRKDAAVTISAVEDETSITYCVRDNGVGFDNVYSDKLFGLFQRLHHVNEFEGVGVGLALVERIIRRHGGKVWAEGVKGEGSAFYFSLPKQS
jgi:PAS domain S-box-containing protein